VLPQQQGEPRPPHVPPRAPLLRRGPQLQGDMMRRKKAAAVYFKIRKFND